MPTLEFTVDLATPLERVWAFHQDVATALPILTPPERRARVVSADLPARVGQRVEVAARGPLGFPVRMVARIVEFRPPDTTAPGEDRAGENPAGGRSALFVDEQEAGPFAAWRHEHRFEAVGAATTRLTDRVAYRVPFGLVGRLADRLFVRRQLVAMFEYRHAATRRAVESVGI